jgi:predicted GNAT family N-acyltransferase
VLKTGRGKNIGCSVLLALEDHAQKTGYEKLMLHAQKHAIGFYKRFGFAEEGEEFLEVSIPHVLMIKALG